MFSLLAGSKLNVAGALLAFAADKVPNEEAQALSPQVGWAMLLGATAFACLFILNRQWWRRWWLTVEDPRTMGLYRIVFGFFVLANVNDLWEYFNFLFTDEGIFPADVARQVHASAQFKGFGDGFTEDDPWGFFDVWGFVEFLKGPKWSLLYFWDSPQFFWGHLAAFEVCATLFIIGFRTRLMGIATFLLMNSLFFRNHLFWEGTEVVYRVFFAYLICAKSGHAYSVDNWLRCRKLRKQGRLSERDGPGGGAGVAPNPEHPSGLAAVYRLIPAWPRRLMMLQLGVVYACTGILKNGSVWARGDAIYYAWNMDHFYRFYPQQLSAIFGTNVLRVMAWGAHWGEVFFFLGVIGVIVNWSRAQKISAATGARLWLSRLCWATIIGVSSAVLWIVWPVHYTPQGPAWAYVGGWTLLMLLIWGMWVGIERRPIKISPRFAAGVVASAIVVAGMAVWGLLLGARRISWRGWTDEVRWELTWWLVAGGAWLVLSIVGLVLLRRRKPELWERLRTFGTTQIDRDWFGRWILGRRIWITWHIALMGGIFVLMNIGQFQTGMLSQTIVFFTGLEWARFLRRIARPLGRWPVFRIPADVRRGEPPLPAEDPSLPHLRRDAAEMPAWSLYLALLGVLAGILVVVFVKPEWNWLRVWYGTGIFVVVVGLVQWWRQRHQQLTVIDPDTHAPRIPWAYGPIGRMITSAVLTWHIVAVGVWLLPDKDSLDAFRGQARKVFALWLTRTQTDQGWGMFAPNPPRSNVFLKVLVTDADGEVHDLRTDVYAPVRKPIPWIWNDRLRKMNRRIIGGESGDTQWYRKWHARYHCRYWALTHDGIEPEKVELVKVSYTIPSPEEVAEKGWYVPEERLEKFGVSKVEYTERCKNAIMGQLPDWIRERHGLPPLPEGRKYRPWLKHKKRAWDRARKKAEEAAAKAAAQEEEKEEEQEDGDKNTTPKLDD